MKKYLEIIEQNNDEQAETQTVKIEVKSKAEAIEKLPDAELEFFGKSRVAYYHICRHEENGHNQPCSVEILEEKK